jgi:uncharacterized tellurite resistance protein B-like protein
MFDKLRTFLAQFKDPQSDRPAFCEDDYRLAAVSLLVHIADADGVVTAFERERLEALIEQRFGLDRQATAKLIAQAERSDHEAVDFYHFTSVLKRSLDEEGRLKIIDMMWDVAFADGIVQEIEENIVWRIAELLGISTRDRVLSRQRIASEPESVGPAEVPSASSSELGNS